MDALTAIKQRLSCKGFDDGKSLSDECIHELIESAMHAPSACNLQHTRFLVVKDPAAKIVLQAIAKGQEKIREASAVFIILGDLEAHKTIDYIAQQGVKNGIYNQEIANAMVKTARVIYVDNPQSARDEAIRSASFAAMNLMTAATALQLASCPMGGFDREKLVKEFVIAGRYLPVMLVAVGYNQRMQQLKKPRLSPQEVAIFDARPGNKEVFGVSE